MDKQENVISLRPSEFVISAKDPWAKDLACDIAVLCRGSNLTAACSAVVVDGAELIRMMTKTSMKTGPVK